ncbi:MAG: NAD(P)-binding domain-containing protein [Actinomycetota bacterium]
MTTITVLSAAEVHDLLDPTELRPALEAAMIALSAGRANVPPRVAAVTPAGFMAAMPGYLDGTGMAAKLVSVFPGNTDLPSHQGLIAVFDPATGTPLAITDAEVITVARTTLCAAIAADVLARPDAHRLAILGGGAQAVAHAEMWAPIRPWSEVIVWNRSPEGAAAVAEAARREGGQARVVDDVNEAVAAADVVALCTHATEALFDPAALRPGTHVSSVGSQDELPREVATMASPVVVEWRDSVVVPPPAGAGELQGLDPAAVVELGDVLAGQAAGRSDSDAITLYKSTGHAVQDVAAARVVVDAAARYGVGSQISL